MRGTSYIVPNCACLADLQIRRLKAIQKKTGLPLSDILRCAIDEYWDRFKKEKI
jgi:hypothetical protein